MAINTGNSWPRNGFTLVRRDNTTEGYVGSYPAQASSNQPIGLGDAVAIVNGIVVPATAGQDPDQAGFGVVVGVYTTAGRPFTQQTVKLIASAQPGRVDVCYDKNAEYIVRCETSVGNSEVDKNVVLAGLSANATTGRSNAAVTVPASASVNDLFRIVRRANQLDITGLNGLNQTGNAGQGVVVRWNRHVFDSRTGGQ
jgi:hypothetical protein